MKNILKPIVYHMGPALSLNKYNSYNQRLFLYGLRGSNIEISDYNTDSVYNFSNFAIKDMDIIDPRRWKK